MTTAPRLPPRDAVDAALAELRRCSGTHSIPTSSRPSCTSSRWMRSPGPCSAPAATPRGRIRLTPPAPRVRDGKRAERDIVRPQNSSCLGDHVVQLSRDSCPFEPERVLGALRRDVRDVVNLALAAMNDHAGRDFQQQEQRIDQRVARVLGSSTSWVTVAAIKASVPIMSCGPSSPAPTVKATMNTACSETLSSCGGSAIGTSPARQRRSRRRRPREIAGAA